jgi:putative transcriptional regulator
MSISHHLDDATLMSFAAGALPDALSAVAAVHIAMCARCRREVAALECVGAALVAELAPAPLHRVEPAMPAPSATQADFRHDGHASHVADPFARLLGAGLDGIPWRRLGMGMWHYPLPVRGAGELRLIKVGPGRAVPEHGHNGSELTLVLRGVLRDATGTYRPGDVADLDETVEHHPVSADQVDCICLVACEKPARFRGLMARLLQPFHGL